ncbi:protein DEFECTIVE IN MERISTEM SILENCING 3-like, partial [Bidens hawaiensis]|uniref:protein DEFECTIVE IN MERISTEM SILENCING 3-like n=1 Tax=Bidens hawaiensis TaxID=980011 RepID=UPI00404AF5F5
HFHFQIHAKLLNNVQLPSSPVVNHVGTALSQAQAFVHSSKKLEDELASLGNIIKKHEENIKHLKARVSTLDHQITDMQITLGKTHSDTKDKDTLSQHATVDHIMQHHKSAASIVCKLKYSESHDDPNSSINDVLGVVATLGKVNDDNINRILSGYLGLETMLALVCTAYKGVEALETYDKEGFVSKSSGLHGLSASIGKSIDGRFNVICLENLRPYVGEFMPDDPQRRLALLKPNLPSGETPQGYVGFAVNMIHLDTAHLSSLTSDGHGLRETLFYNLFSKLQVYDTRPHMLQALPFLSHGAISLDGGLVRSNGVLVFGTGDEMKVRFARKFSAPDNLVDIEKKLKELKWTKETSVEEVHREEAMLTHFKYTFEVKKQEFVRFMAQSSPYVMQYPVQATPRR